MIDTDSVSDEHESGSGSAGASEPSEPAWVSTDSAAEDDRSDAMVPVDPEPAGAPAAPAEEPAGGPPTEPAATSEHHRRAQSPNMLPARETRRSSLERVLVRLIATAGIVGIGVAIAAIMVSSKSQGWVIGLVVSLVSVVLSAVLWSSRQL